MGPHGGLSLRGGTGCPAPHWNNGTNENDNDTAKLKNYLFTQCTDADRHQQK